MSIELRNYLTHSALNNNIPLTPLDLSKLQAGIATTNSSENGSPVAGASDHLLPAPSRSSLAKSLADDGDGDAVKLNVSQGLDCEI